MKRSKLIAFSGILSALSVVIIFLGTVISVFAYVAPILSGLVLILAINNIDKKSALLIYAVVSVITVILMPDKECSLTYIFFFGYYPIIKPRLQGIKSTVLRVLLKLIIFNFGIVESQLICFYIFGIPFDDIFGKWGIAILLILANVILLVYDRLLDLINVIYMKKYYNRIKNILR